MSDKEKAKEIAQRNMIIYDTEEDTANNIVYPTIHSRKECEKSALEMAEWKDDQFKKLCESGEASDGYHTFNELYEFRRAYNAALVNTGVWPAHKSYRHHDGELCFGGGWFIVMMETPYGQISNHYENKYWDEFHCEEKEVADEWDGHTEKDVLERLTECNKNNILLNKFKEV